MARTIEHNKITQDESGVSLEHRAAYDDSLLPSAEELSKLQSIDPEIIPWLMRQTEKNEDGRLLFNRQKMKLAYKEVNLSALLTFCGLFFGTLIIIGVFWLSYLLITGGYSLAGSVFGTIDLVALILVLTKFKSNR